MDELDSGKRREGVFGAIYWWMVKFGFAIAGLFIAWKIFDLIYLKIHLIAINLLYPGSNYH